MTAICVPIFVKSGADLEEVITSAEEVLEGTEGMIELRCDTATPRMMLEAIDLARLPVLVTVRPTWEGGFSEKSDKERIALWEEAMEAGADYVDVELVSWEKSRAIREAVEDTAEKNGTRLVISNHCFERRPKDLMERIGRLRAVAAARVLKIAWKAESLVDAVEALRLSREVRAEDGRPLVALAMGEEGLLSRLLARKFDATFTFASAAKGKESAPGQPTVGELRERYRWAKQSAGTAVYGVAGWPVGHSLSPHIHNAGFEREAFDGVYVPLPIKPEYEAFAKAVLAIRAGPGMNLRGLSVTIPHKENAIRFVREQGGTIDELSQRIGVINTMVWRADGSVYGLNSDYAGALDALVSAWDGKRETLTDKRVAVIGAGGAARAIVCGLAACGATVFIYNRTQERAEALAMEFSLQHGAGKVVAVPWEKLCESSCEAYINCTPLGMFPKVNESPIEREPAWSAETVVFDTVYNPLKTKFLKLAERKNLRIVPGTEMFVRQAAIQFQEFTGKKAPVGLFRETLLRALKG